MKDMKAREDEANLILEARRLERQIYQVKARIQAKEKINLQSYLPLWKKKFEELSEQSNALPPNLQRGIKGKLKTIQDTINELEER